ncbi:MAG: M23 family metallopeptidase [Marinifilaceae bacterium]|jgi:hypothetical protein|nr:M23 family metallopeptidase [Marinifilaceae bacterium]
MNALIKIKFSLLFLLCFVKFGSCQTSKYPKDFFRSPVDFPITLSGSFAELRNNHFHSGIDIRTFSIGKLVYASASGYISRIKVSASGFGRALYLTHPNGYVTVYGHLNKFSSKIENFIKAYQYKNKKFALDIDLNPNQFPVKKSEVIAFSGNSGSSGGPHLHFEIRDEKSEDPINPLYFGIKIKDTTPPKIYNLYIYPQDTSSRIDGKYKKTRINLVKRGANYVLNRKSKLQLSGLMGFGVQVNDFMDNTWGRCGIHMMQMFVNDSLRSSFKLERFSFSNSRYINSHMDYELNKIKNKKIHKSFIEKNNDLSVYHDMINRGFVNFKDGKNYNIRFDIYDWHGNKSAIIFSCQGVKTNSNYVFDKNGIIINCDSVNEFKERGVEFKFRPKTFYSDIKYDYLETKDSVYGLSDCHKIFNNKIPIHKYFTLKIRCKKNIKIDTNKLYVAKKLGKAIYYSGGVYVDGWMITKSKSLGEFVVCVDTIPPVIKPISYFKNPNFRRYRNIKFKVYDKHTGIKKYNAYIDGKWVLMERDLKTRTISYTFDKTRLKKGIKHSIVLELEDLRGNKSKFKSSFYW